MKERILRALGILFAVALIAGGILTAVIAEEAPTVSIEYFTLSHENAVYIEYAVDYRGFDGVPGNTGMLYWTKEPVKPELGTEDSRSGMLGYDEINGQKYYIFKYANLTAAQMCDDIWACAYATVDGITYYSNVEKYSVETYAARKLGLVPGVEGTKDETLKDLLRAMLEYGEKAQKHFKDARQDIYPTDILHPVTVTFDADNGTTPTAQTVWRNRKPAKPADPTKNGYTFAGWRNGNTEWNFDTDTVTEDVTLTAHWNVAIRYSEGLSFDSNGDGTCSVSGIGTCTDTELNIPPVALDNERVTGISRSAFRGCENLTNVTIPDCVISIGYYAFNGCSSLTTITIPFVGASMNETSATHFGFIFGASSDDHNSKYVPSSLRTVIVTGGTNIGDYAFSDCSSLTSIAIPDSMTSIGASAFYGCSSLSGVYITNLAKWCDISFISDEGNPLYYAHNLYLNGTLVTDLDIPNSVTSIGSSVFSGCSSLTSITIPESVTSIGKKAFSYCNNLTNIVIPESVTSIENYAFFGCSSLTNITIPKSVTNIGEYAFYKCSSLKCISIPNGVTSIGASAFYECSSLASITIPSSVTSIGSYVFSRCSSLEDITVASGNTVYHSRENCLIETATKRLITGCKTSVIPSDGSVASIGVGAFFGCSSLESITIPNSVTNIGYAAFNECSGMTSITIPTSVTSIGSVVFQKCSSLTSITFNGTVAQWQAIKKSYWYWHGTVICTDGIETI